jgi:serine protease
MYRMRRVVPACGAAALLTLAACTDVPSAANESLTQPAAVTVPSNAQAEPVVPGEILVALRGDDDFDVVGRDFGLVVAERGHRNAFAVMRGAAGNEQAIAARLRGDARVRYAEPNYLRQPVQAAVNTKLWGFYNDGTKSLLYTSGTSSGQVVSTKLPKNDADIDANGLGEVSAASAAGSAMIGSIDTGVEFTHPEFAGGTLIAGRDWVNNDNDPSDGDNHGTHTTGTMAGRTVGVAGVTGANTGSASKVRVYVQRVCGPRGCATSAIVNAIRAAADYVENGQHLVAMNLSLGGASISTAEQDAIKYATDLGVLVIASAGNDGTTTVSCPACDPNALSVAALNWGDVLSYYSNRGAGLDISAPGGEMFSNTTEDGGIYSAVRGGAYAFYQGTSMAAPMVTGVAGVVSLMTGLRGAALRSRLLATADDLGADGYDTQFGAGRVNLLRAVNNVTSGGGGGGTPALTVSIAKSCVTNSNSSATCTLTGSTNGASPFYSWSWNDAGTIGVSQAVITRTFTAAGSSTATLTVTASGASASSSSTVSCKLTGKQLRCS